MRIEMCSACGQFMNCDEIDAAYDSEYGMWMCGPCVRRAREEGDVDG